MVNVKEMSEYVAVIYLTVHQPLLKCKDEDHKWRVEKRTICSNEHSYENKHCEGEESDQNVWFLS